MVVHLIALNAIKRRCLMLTENQVKRLLKQSEKAHVSNEHKNYNKGWLQALRLVLEEDTYPIRKDALDVK
jgi:hypothetical protein